MSDNSTPIKALFQVVSVKTVVSGAIRVTFDMSEDALDEMRDLTECKNKGWLLEAVMLLIKPDIGEKNERKVYY